MVLVLVVTTLHALVIIHHVLEAFSLDAAALITPVLVLTIQATVLVLMDQDVMVLLHV